MKKGSEHQKNAHNKEVPGPLSDARKSKQEKTKNRRKKSSLRKKKWA